MNKIIPNFLSRHPSQSTARDPRKQKILYHFVLIIIFFLFLFLVQNKLPDNFKYIKVGYTTLKVEIVSTPEAQERGLSGRRELKDNAGMLFVFNSPDKYYFWMKDMNFSIDMIYLDENLNVVYLKKNATPESYPEAFSPDKNALYVCYVCFSVQTEQSSGSRRKAKRATWNST